MSCNSPQSSFRPSIQRDGRIPGTCDCLQLSCNLRGYWIGIHLKSENSYVRTLNTNSFRTFSNAWLLVNTFLRFARTLLYPIQYRLHNWYIFMDFLSPWPGSREVSIAFTRTQAHRIPHFYWYYSLAVIYCYLLNKMRIYLLSRRSHSLRCNWALCRTANCSELWPHHSCCLVAEQVKKVAPKPIWRISSILK